SQAQFLGPPSCVSGLLGWRVPRNRVSGLSVGQTHIFRDLTITAVAARHVAGVPGWESDDAIGLLLDCGGLRVYHRGATEYELRLRALAYDKAHHDDVYMMVIIVDGGILNTL